MNTVLQTSPFAKLELDDSTYNGALHLEGRFHRQFSKVTGSPARDKDSSRNGVQRTNSGRFSKTASADRNSSLKVTSTSKSREISFTVRSSSVAGLQGNNVTVSNTVVNVHSRTTMKRESRNNVCLETDDSRKDAISGLESGAGNRRAFEKTVETDITQQASDSSTESIRSFEKKRNQSPNSARSTQDGTIEDAPLGRPLELVEIYPGNKEQSKLGFSGRHSDEIRAGISTRFIVKEDDLSSKSSTLKEDVFLFTEVRSKKGKKVCPVDPSGEEYTKGNDRDYEENFYEISSATLENTLGQSTRDRRKLDDRKIEEDLETKIRRSKDENSSKASEPVAKQFEIEKKSNPPSTPIERSRSKEKREEEDEKIGLERSEKFQDSVKPRSRWEYRFSTTVDDPETSSRRSKMKSDEKLSLNREKSANSVYENTSAIEEEDRNIALAPSPKLNASVNSSESESSRSLLDSDRSSVFDRSDTDSSTMENTVIDLRERSPSSERRNVITNKKSAKVIAEKREIEKNEIGAAEIVNNILLRDENDRTSMIDDLEIGNDRGTGKKMEWLSIEDFKLGTIDLRAKQPNVNRNGIKICEILTKIYDNLLCDWQIMESIRIKHRGDVSVDSICSKMTLLLLNRTIERCKDYIYSSDNNYKAELEITELCSKDVIQLVKAVNWNKRVIERHDRQLDRIQPGLRREENANRKRRIFNETVAFWDQWTCEISYLIGSIFALIKDVAVNNEEKENVQNSRRCKSTNRHATSFPNDRKEKHGLGRPKVAKINLPVKRDSSDETQMSAALNTNTSVKQSRSRTSVKITPRSREKERLLEVARNRVEKKTIDTGIRHREEGRLAWKSTFNTDFNRSKQPTSRQKYRAPGNPHPVWRPGGSVKLPTSSSATILTQKSRPFVHAKEKTNQTVENTKEAKQGRATIESKKRVSHEIYSTSRYLVPTLAINGSKITSKRSNLSLKTSPRLEPRPGSLRIGSKGYSKALCHSESACTKSCEKTSSWESLRRKSPKESRVLRALEEIVKSTPLEKRGNKNANERLTQTIAIKKETKIHEEEPTRDIDASQITSLTKYGEETFSENRRLMGKLPENSRLVEKLPEKPRLVEQSLEKPRLVDKLPKELRLVEKSSEKPRLVDKLPKETRLVEKSSEKPRLVDKLPKEPRLVEKSSEKPRLVDKLPKETRLVEKSSEKPRLVDKLPKETRLVEKSSEKPRLVNKLPELQLMEKSSTKLQSVEKPSEKSQLAKKLPGQPVTNNAPFSSISVKKDVTDTEVGVNLGSSQPNTCSSFVSVTSTSCVAEFSSSSGSIARIESSKCCQTSLNSGSSSCTSNPESKIERSRKRDNLQVSFADRIEDRRRYDWIVRKENSNDATVAEEKSRNLSIVGNEKSNSPLVARKENSNDSTVREEKSKIPSIIKIKKFDDPLVLGKENFSVSTVGERKSKNLSITRKEKSNSFTVVRKKNSNNPTVGEEKSKNPLTTKEKKFISSSVKEGKTGGNFHPPLMNMLKEFLCSQGVDVELVNKAERCLREKQKICKCLKMKSVSFDDVPSSVRSDQNSETTLKRYRELEQVFESNEDTVDRGDRSKIVKTLNCLLQPPPEKRDTATCTECPSSSQIALQSKSTKSLQTNLEENATTKLNIQTQTETDSTEHFTNEHREKTSEVIGNSTKSKRNASSMTDTLLTDNRFTETVSYDSKSVATEHVHCSNDFDEKLRDSRKNSNDLTPVEGSSEKYKKIRNDDRNSTKNREFDRSSTIIQCRDESSRNVEQNGESNASMSSTSLDLTSKCLENSNRNENMDEESMKLPVKVLSSRTIAAIHLTAIRALNVYLAVEIYKQSLKDKLKLENRSKDDETKNIENCKDSSSSLHESKEVDIIITKNMDRFDSDDEVEESETTRKMDVASCKEYVDRPSKSQCAISRSVSTSRVSFVESTFREIDLEFPEKSSSSVATKDTRSLMKFLVRETERATNERIYRVEKVTHDTRSKFRTISKEETENNQNNEFSMFSRENLLPLVYGIVCCIVFWCLQFTITCDVVA